MGMVQGAERGALKGENGLRSSSKTCILRQRNKLTIVLGNVGLAAIMNTLLLL